MTANRREPTFRTIPEGEDIYAPIHEPDSFFYGSSSDEDSRRVVWLVLIIAGTAIGGLIAYFVVRWYETRQLEAALQKFERTVTDMSFQAQREAAFAAERLRLAQRKERERAAAEIASREAAKRHAEEIQARRIAAENAEAARRDVAWRKFYQPSELCRNPDNRASIQCANEHARAKKEFEKRWAEGKL